MVPADSGGIPRVPPYSGFRLMQDVLRVRGFHALWRRFPAPSASMTCNFVAALQPRRRRNAAGLGSSPFARHYSGNHSYFLLLRVLRCFSSPRSPGCRLYAGGLPHSGTRGSKAACAYPRIFAACRALRRLREPRHPPCAFFHFVCPRRPCGAAARLSSFPVPICQ